MDIEYYDMGAADPLAPIVSDPGTAVWDGQTPSWGASPSGGSFWSGGGSPVNTAGGMSPPSSGSGGPGFFDYFKTAVQGAVAYQQASQPWGARPGVYPSPYGTPGLPPGYRIDPMTGRPIPGSPVSLVGPLSSISMQTWVYIGLGVAALLILGKRKGA